MDASAVRNQNADKVRGLLFLDWHRVHIITRRRFPGPPGEIRSVDNSNCSGETTAGGREGLQHLQGLRSPLSTRPENITPTTSRQAPTLQPMQVSAHR